MCDPELSAKQMLQILLQGARENANNNFWYTHFQNLPEEHIGLNRSSGWFRQKGTTCNVFLSDNGVTVAVLMWMAPTTVAVLYYKELGGEGFQEVFHYLANAKNFAERMLVKYWRNLELKLPRYEEIRTEIREGRLQIQNDLRMKGLKTELRFYGAPDDEPDL